MVYNRFYCVNPSSRDSRVPIGGAMIYLNVSKARGAILFVIAMLSITFARFASAGVIMEPNYFGGHIHRPIPTALWEKVGFGSVRVHDANVAWLDLEARKGEFNWTKLDQIVGRVRSTGADVLLPRQTTPEWAA